MSTKTVVVVAAAIVAIGGLTACQDDASSNHRFGHIVNSDTPGESSFRTAARQRVRTRQVIRGGDRRSTLLSRYTLRPIPARSAVVVLDRRRLRGASIR
jgi:hypothetical protein